MTPQHAFVTDDIRWSHSLATEASVSGRNCCESSGCWRTNPYQRGDWLQKTRSGRELQVKRYGNWLLSFWLDEPVLEVRIVDVRKLVP